ncbi:MAG: cadherin-like beta sandwich domain-containing protein [Bacilli bacterium]|nr:cadherin-like beta sandwich domain-containing protein [Bacilli bacterium]
MRKINKVTMYLFMILFSFVIFSSNVFAYGYDVTVTSNTVTVGNSITLKITCEGIGGRFNITSSNSNVASLSNSSLWVENNTQSITITTKQVGSATITIIPSNVSTSDADAKDVTLNNKAITITVKEKPKPSNNNSGSSGSINNGSNNVSKTKSSNNYLSSLTIDNFELNESFDKENLEYALTVPTDTEKIKINAQLEDSNSKVSGVGEVNLSQGLNTFEIVVTAENGSKKTYVLKVTVLEEEPIKVKIDNQEYTVVRKRKDLPSISEYFEEKDIEINNQKVEGYHNEVLDYIVIGLKDSKGLIEYYIYKNNKYERYLEYIFNGTTIQVLDKELLGGYKKTNFIYNNDKIPSYQEVKLDIIKNTYALDNNDISGNQFYLFYGKNVETGKEYLYQYDALEKTIQRYNTLILDMYKERSDKYYTYLISSIILLVLVIIIFNIILICNRKKHKKNMNIKLEKDLPSKKEKEYEENEIQEIKDLAFGSDDIPIKKEKKLSKKRKN